MDHREQGLAGAAPHQPSAVGAGKKTTGGLLDHIDALWDVAESGGQRRIRRRAKALALSALACLGRRTVTGLLSTSASQFVDWSAAYRLFACERFDAGAVLDTVLNEVIAMQPGDVPVVAAVDDTLLRKRGRKIAGVSWRRDPLGPPFSTNFIRAQRMLQLSLALPCGGGAARMVPVDFVHAPSPTKPRRTATTQHWRRYREELAKSRLSLVAAQRLARLRQRMDAMADAHQRPLIAVGDGGYTNRTVLGALPERTAFIGRVRADAKLYHLPAPPRPGQRGRRRTYGESAPTPEQIRQNDAVPWQSVRVYATGRWHDFRIKTVAPLRWRATGGSHDLRLVVIAPLAYRPRKGAHLLYRSPAYLICTDPAMPLHRLLQAYVWRWDIEVNIRDEKTLLGVGQAQVRTPASVQAVPALIVAAYATLLVAAARAFAHGDRPGQLPPSKWQRALPPPRASTQDLIRQFRAELWGRALGIANFPDFAKHHTRAAKSENHLPNLASAVLYACA